MQVVNQGLNEGGVIEIGECKTKKISNEYTTPRLHAVCESGTLEKYVVLRKVVNHGDDISFPADSMVLGTTQNSSKANIIFVWYAIPKSHYGGSQ